MSVLEYICVSQFKRLAQRGWSLRTNVNKRVFIHSHATVWDPPHVEQSQLWACGRNLICKMLLYGQTSTTTPEICLKWFREPEDNMASFQGLINLSCLIKNQPFAFLTRTIGPNTGESDESLQAPGPRCQERRTGSGMWVLERLTAAGHLRYLPPKSANYVTKTYRRARVGRFSNAFGIMNFVTTEISRR